MKPEELFSLKGQTCVVIGGTGELCGAIAIGYAEAGAEVVLVGRSEEKAAEKLAVIEAAGGSGYFLPADVSSAGSLQDLLNQVVDRSGKVDILVNGAGVNSATPFLEIPEDEWSRIIDVNLTAVFRACQVFGEYMKNATHPCSIVNIGSMSGLTPLSRVFTYSATKAAVHNLSKNLAREWGENGVRVNTLVPGFFPAEQNRAVLDESRIASIMNHTPMNRFGNSDELLGAALLLAAPKAGAFITGIEMVVDGGFNSMSL